MIADRVETSGRFLLFVTAAHAFRRRQRVLWLSFNGAYTNELTRQGMKKIGCTLASNESAKTTPVNNNDASSVFVDSTQTMTIRSIVQEYTELILKTSGEVDGEMFVRKIYNETKEWIVQSSVGDEKCCILLDDVSALADLVGQKLAYAFVYQLRTALQSKSISLLVRCSGDGWETPTNTQVEWVGGCKYETESSLPPWESSLLDLCDCVVDVLPLQSGYSREAHGRLLMTPLQDLGVTLVRYNYCLMDQGVFAIRLTPQRFR